MRGGALVAAVLASALGGFTPAVATYEHAHYQLPKRVSKAKSKRRAATKQAAASRKQQRKKP